MAINSKARHDLTLRAIKREISAGRDVAFGSIRRTRTLTTGCLMRMTSRKSRSWRRRTMIRWTRQKMVEKTQSKLQLSCN